MAFIAIVSVLSAQSTVVAKLKVLQELKELCSAPNDDVMHAVAAFSAIEREISSQ